LAGEIERVLIRETEKKKYIPSEIVRIMQQEGYPKFKMGQHTELWQTKQAKDENKHFGAKVSKTWYWYDSWLAEVRKYCLENKARFQ
jgi:hypothetical protein